MLLYLGLCLILCWFCRQLGGRGPKVILIHVEIQLSQDHLLKRLFSLNSIGPLVENHLGGFIWGFVWILSISLYIDPYASATVSLLLFLCSKFWNQVVWVFLFILLLKIALVIWDTLQFPVNFSVSFSDCIRMSVEILLEIMLNLSSEICEVYNMISALFFFSLVYF